MTWVKIDDQFHGHPKTVHAWAAHHASIGLHMLALSHCANHLTDGFVSGSWVLSKLPRPAERHKAVQALLDAELWEVREDGYEIHDYLDFNESREQVLGRRAELSEARAEAGRRGAESRWQTDGKRHGKPMAPSPYPFPTTS